MTAAPRWAVSSEPPAIACTVPVIAPLGRAGYAAYDPARGWGPCSNSRAAATRRVRSGAPMGAFQPAFWQAETRRVPADYRCYGLV